MGYRMEKSERDRSEMIWVDLPLTRHHGDITLWYHGDTVDGNHAPVAKYEGN